jgi:hypothetical protein
MGREYSVYAGEAYEDEFRNTVGKVALRRTNSM